VASAHTLGSMSSGVPKSLGVVSCEGCGVRSHRGTLGVAMHCCAGCSNVRLCTYSQVAPVCWPSASHAAARLCLHAWCGATAGRRQADGQTDCLSTYACVQAWYCSPLCERACWPRHSIDCRAQAQRGVCMTACTRSKARHTATDSAGAAVRRRLRALRQKVRASFPANVRALVGRGVVVHLRSDDQARPYACYDVCALAAWRRRDACIQTSQASRVSSTPAVWLPVQWPAADFASPGFQVHVPVALGAVELACANLTPIPCA